MSDEIGLRVAWGEHVGDGPASMAALDDVVGRHRQPQRRYHGVRHVTWVVRHVNELVAEVDVTDVAAVVAAAFFHDAVYDPMATDNEEQSARLARRVLGDLGWPLTRTARVATMVRATADHTAHRAAGEPTRAALDTAVLLDADLAVLGSEPSAYQAYVTGVRAEYGHLDDAAWRAGRAAVLDRLLAADPLFATAAGRRRWAARARVNLAAERAQLTST